MNEETFLDWLFMSLTSLVSWSIGYFSQPRNPQVASANVIRVPSWLAILAGKGWGNNVVEIRSFAIQLYGFALFVLATLVALFEPDHQKRVLYFRGGLIIFLFVTAVVLEIMLLLRRK